MLRNVLSFNWPIRLLLAAALLHIVLAVGLNLAGRFQLAPGFIDRDGIIPSFALDSYTYQRAAIPMTRMLKEQGVRAWLAEPEGINIKLVSLQFALFGGTVGYGPLSSELLNLFCYLATLLLVYAIGKELSGERAGLIAAGTVAVFPTFLLHTTQLLKDPLFIAGGLAFILIVTTMLTRTYTRRTAVLVSVITVLSATLLLRIRFQFGVVLLAAVVFGLVLLVIRQILERRLLAWNLVCPVLVLMAGALWPYYMTKVVEKYKQFEPTQIGPSKNVGAVKQIPSFFTYASSATEKVIAAPGTNAPLSAIARWATSELYSARHNFNIDVLEAGSAIDQGFEFKTIGDVFRYLPRAFEVGMWAPFPNTWARRGKHVGNAGMLLAASETTFIYLCQLLALVAVCRGTGRLSSLMLLLLTTFGVTMLGMVVSNVGTLYRLRYLFWILMIVLAAKGLLEIVAIVRSRRSNLVTT